MKNIIPAVKPDIKEREDMSLLFIIMGSVLLLFIIKDTNKYEILLHAVYATFLIATGMIIFNTTKFKVDSFSTFLGLVFAATGVLECIYLFNCLGAREEVIIGTNITISAITDLFPILGVYLSFKFVKDNKQIHSSIILFVVAVVLTTSSLFIISGICNSLDRGTLHYTLGVVTSIFMIIASIMSGIELNSSSNVNKWEYSEKKFFNRIIIITILSRVPNLLHIVIGNRHIEGMLSQIIINVSLYYLYNYIVSKNIKKTALELHDTNEELTIKTESLKEKNKKLIYETEKIEELKEILIKRELRLQSTLDVAVNSIVVFSKDGEITYANKSFRNIFGDYKEQGKLSNKVKNFNDLIESINYVFINKKNIEKFIDTSDNKVYQAIFAPLIIATQIEGVLCVLKDKTKKKEYERKFIEANKRSEDFLESVGDGIVVLEGSNKIYVNNACRQIFKETLENIDFSSICKSEESIEKRYVIEGEVKYVEMSFSHYNNEGTYKTIIVIRDTTSRKISQIKLEESQSSYSRFIDILPDGICLLREDLSVNYANKSFLDMLSFTSIDDVKDSNIKILMNANTEEKIKFTENMTKVLNENKSILLLEYELINNYDDIVEVELSALPFAIYNTRYIMLIIKDLAHKKYSEQAEKELLERFKTDKIKTEFFANMSHELKTPLNVISSSNQLVDSFYRSEKIKDYNNNIKSHVDLVRQSSYRLQRLINNIIDLTKMESGFYTLKLAKYNIVSVIEDLFMNIEEYASRKDIRILFDTELEEINVYVDKAEIERIMLNLLSNCIKFTDNGGWIYVNIYYKIDKVIISVKDTGVGIPQDKLELIFEEFSQVDKTLSRNTEGSGIGLAIVKNLVSLHGGDIEVISEVNKGTEFLISLPMKSFSNEYYTEDKRIYNLQEKIKIEFSDIYY
ncbi:MULTISPECIES: ATP-binding protein [unclassified Clostridioides]|uniref:sensor histidine kinase n=1 Tax=unclassified Clostridioides TaxID=2635829 RepID=UPI001D10FC0E|nr:PAS domain-containing protein [Clostridioides sp. ZZV15-6388]MCC0642929.1 PAS domain-containing protein [Clostridioides sp. ZZV14-6150]MCC0660125.1 PAS domain-containing protein [Clostridioides sp. ZZV14-6154]MCC0664240.1 PAS domain-containing protein [Clostridioides sp. ZZV15-6597]MCC0667313.1 PAS domain-containing protein [Clostridioides sp. ZZV14-6153]MCC0717191.1 PAS domain-containing protein [Clostridioides sp. ZZV14-6105]MCC0728052.1 PAS domain-containing protein [Clostridioides sp. 